MGSDVFVINDRARRGAHGEPTLWTLLIERLGCAVVECSEGEDAKAMRARARRTPTRPKLWIQNASWNPPFAGGREPYVAVLMDDLRGLKDERAAAQVEVLARAAAIVVNSEALKASYSEFAAKITVIPLGVDTEFWQRPVGSHGIPLTSRKRVVFVGDSTAQKGWMKVVSLASAREDLDWTFVLKSLVEKLMPPGRLEVAVPRERVRALLCNADAFILGSTCEGGSQAPLEAMACGLPVVMPPAGDFATWKPRSYFEVAPPYDARAMGVALDRCLAANWPIDPRDDLLKAGRYTLDAVEAAWRALLEGLLR